MSIVEKALAKVQSAGARPPAAVVPAAVNGRPNGARRDPAEGGVATPPVIHTGGSFTLDQERLRRDGLLAPAEFARRIVDEYRRIKWSVIDLAFGRSRPAAPSGNVVVVTSAVPGEGKSFSAMNLALALAMERDCSVLLIDADLARPRISTVLGLMDRPGLSDALLSASVDWRNYTLDSGVPGLRVLPAGRRSSDSPELLGSKRMEELVEQCTRLENEIVIIDSAPLLATTEAQVLARLAGQIVMVVRANSTPQPAVGEALELLDRSKPIGLVLNQARSVFGDYNYYGYYDEQENKPG
jgi:protein-tyrosine kinase